MAALWVGFPILPLSCFARRYLTNHVLYIRHGDLPSDGNSQLELEERTGETAQVV